MEEIDKFINSNSYKENLELAVEKRKVTIVDDYYNALLKIAKKNLDKAELEISDLNEVISDNLFSSFMLAKIENLFDDQNEEYPKGKEPDEDEKTITTKIHGKSITFIIDNLIEFYFLKNNPEGLNGYIKAIGIPQSNKFAKELGDIYNQLK